jgi:peroxin-5
VLSEAALALEAAVRADGQLCEGWRLLGTVHAENDDDRRAIAAMTKANEADPTNLEVLLSLGVSHTNELDQEDATGFMRAWLRNQPRFAALEAEYAASIGPGAPDTPASVLALFKRAAAAAPVDADVHAVLVRVGTFHSR